MFSFRPFLRPALTAVWITLLTTLTLSCVPLSPSPIAKLAPFTSDGCSLFPDATLNDRTTWCDCCQKHDLAYWQGGSAEERNQADAALRDCVLERTKDQKLAETMYLGARAGGHPAFPTWYRWGYGWSYGRGYQPLSAAERLQVQKGMRIYKQQHPT